MISQGAGPERFDSAVGAVKLNLDQIVMHGLLTSALYRRDRMRSTVDQNPRTAVMPTAKRP
jgi:hypothetical protein